MLSFVFRFFAVFVVCVFFATYLKIVGRCRRVCVYTVHSVPIVVNLTLFIVISLAISYRTLLGYEWGGCKLIDDYIKTSNGCSIKLAYLDCYF